MEILGFAEARARLGAVLEAVVADHNPVAIARRKGGAVVLVSLADWQAMEERLRLWPARGKGGALAGVIGELDTDNRV